MYPPGYTANVNQVEEIQSLCEPQIYNDPDHDLGQVEKTVANVHQFEEKQSICEPDDVVQVEQTVETEVELTVETLVDSNISDIKEYQDVTNIQDKAQVEQTVENVHQVEQKQSICEPDDVGQIEQTVETEVELTVETLVDSIISDSKEYEYVTNIQDKAHVTVFTICNKQGCTFKVSEKNKDRMKTHMQTRHQEEIEVKHHMEASNEEIVIEDETASDVIQLGHELSTDSMGNKEGTEQDTAWFLKKKRKAYDDFKRFGTPLRPDVKYGRNFRLLNQNEKSKLWKIYNKNKEKFRILNKYNY